MVSIKKACGMVKAEIKTRNTINGEMLALTIWLNQKRRPRPIKLNKEKGKKDLTNAKIFSFCPFSSFKKWYSVKITRAACQRPK
jgi:hypothetical protein